MRRADDPQAVALATQVQAFVTRNQHLIQSGAGSARAWYQALRDQQWYVPHWPATYGGLDWTPLQTYILQRELLRVGALLPNGATTHLLASWIFRWLPEQKAAGQAQGRRWLAGIAGRGPGAGGGEAGDLMNEGLAAQSVSPERWRVGVDIRQPDWPRQALIGEARLDDAHWVLQPYPLEGAKAGAVNQDRALQGQWALGVLPGALLLGEAEKLNSDPSHQAVTEVELGVEQRWPPIISGLSLTQLEAMLKPIQLAWQDLDTPSGAFREIGPGLTAPSVTLGWRLERIQQVLAVADDLQAEHERLHESQIALVALQVMEARAVQATTAREPLVPGAELRQAVDQSAERLAWRVAQLEADTLGYFTLPLFDARLQHNEGPVTPALYDALVSKS